MIVVDPAVWPWRGRSWAHLASDSDLVELHDFAARLGLRRLAFQGDHYDVDEANRLRALRAGATPVDARQLVRRLRAAGLRRHGPRAGLRWQVLGEWPLPGAGEEVPAVAANGLAAHGLPVHGLPAVAAKGLPMGALAELLRAARALPVDDVVLRRLTRPGEEAAVVARRGCELPLPLPELVVARAGRPRPSSAP